MAKWTPFPHAGDYRFDAASVKKQWSRLHGGDAEPCPKDAAVLEAWALFHNGDFEKATAAGLAAGGAGITVANKATAIAFAVVFVELWAIVWIQNRYMETPFLRATFQIVLGGALVLAAGILIGGA